MNCSDFLKCNQYNTHKDIEHHICLFDLICIMMAGAPFIIIMYMHMQENFDITVKYIKNISLIIIHTTQFISSADIDELSGLLSRFIIMSMIVSMIINECAFHSFINDNQKNTNYFHEFSWNKSCLKTTTNITKIKHESITTIIIHYINIGTHIIMTFREISTYNITGLFLSIL